MGMDGEDITTGTEEKPAGQMAFLEQSAATIEQTDTQKHTASCTGSVIQGTACTVNVEE